MQLKNKKMKKLVLLFVTAVALVSCGKDKKETTAEAPKNEAISLEIEGVYEKDDSVKVFYQVAGYLNYDNPIIKTVKGSPLSQKIVFDIPAGIPAENFAITASTNKEQAYITITNITVKNGNEVIDGGNYKYSENFATDTSFSWDDKNARYNVSHSNKYPPAIVGKETLVDLMDK